MSALERLLIRLLELARQRGDHVAELNLEARLAALRRSPSFA